MVAILLIDKTTGMKSDKKTIAKSGEEVEIYNTDHYPVYLCKTKRGESFPINIEFLNVKTENHDKA